MRRLSLPLLALLALASAADAAAPGVQLTLTGPKATRYGHTVDLAGRSTPAAPGGQVRLYSGDAFVASTRMRADGSYRFRVAVGRPGPFHAVWNGVRSKPLRILVHPTLTARLLGTRVAGEPLSVAVRLEPAAAGHVRVRILREEELAYGRVVHGAGRVRVGTSTLDPVRVSIESLPADGYAAVSRDVGVALRAPALAYGSRSPFVPELVRRLGDLGYAAPSERGVFDGDVQQSVYAFQKAQGLERTGVADATFWRRLERPAEIVPRIRTARDHLEIDKRRQILLVVRGGRVTLVVPVSTAGIPGYYTPEGRFSIIRKVPGYDPSPLGVLYKPMYFYGGYAIHGNPSVPPWPASHGCVRVPNFMADRLFVSEPYGEPVYVYS